MEKIRTLESTVTVAAGLVLVVLGDALAAEQPQAAVISSLFILPLIIAGINQRLYSQHFSLTVVYNIGLLILNDQLIRTYIELNGLEDQGLIATTFFVTLAVSLVPMLLHGWQTGKTRPANCKFCTFCRCGITIILGILTALGYYSMYLI